MLIAVAGQTLLLAALLIALSGMAMSAIGGFRIMRSDPDLGMSIKDGAYESGERWLDLALGAPRLLFLAVSAATFLLLTALVTHEYTLAYVTSRTSNDLSLGFRLTALWAGQEGSLLLWLFLLAGYAMLMQRTLYKAKLPAAVVAFATSTILAVATFFAMLVALIARPFAVVELLPRDGSGMSPALQNYWMAAHPPALYLGYVGVAIPFAIMVGALLAKRKDDAWVASLRGWVMASWIYLTMGLVLGGRWAYEEIGWGGYWAWDPVENAALMPWLTATALLHSIMVQQRRGMMRFWNAILASFTFALSIFGTFITRSGVLSSVHSFVSSPVGWWFIAALAIIAVGTFILLYKSRGLLRAEHDVDAVISRETLLLFNNIILVALTLVVLWGVTYPLMTAAFSDARISLEKPWYDFFAAAFGLPLTALVAFAPVIAWRGSPAKRVARRMIAPLVLCGVTGGILIALGYASSVSGLAAVCLGLLVIFGVAVDAVRTVRSRRTAASESWAHTFKHVSIRHRKRWGAWLAHAGLGFIVIAIAGSAWTTRVESEMRPDDRVTIGQYELTYKEIQRERRSSSMSTSAVFAVTHKGKALPDMRAGRDFYPASGESSNEVAVRHDWLRIQDLFITLDRLTEDATIRAVILINPLVPLLWFGSFVMIIGAVIAFPARNTLPVGTKLRRRVEESPNAVHGMRNRTSSSGELLSSVRSSTSGSED